MQIREGRVKNVTCAAAGQMMKVSKATSSNLHACSICIYVAMPSCATITLNHVDITNLDSQHRIACNCGATLCNYSQALRQPSNSDVPQGSSREPRTSFTSQTHALATCCNFAGACPDACTSSGAFPNLEAPCVKSANFQQSPLFSIAQICRKVGH